MRIAVGQIDTTAGDVPGNADLIGQAWQRAREAGADLFVAPEMAIVGYPPRDLLLRSSLIRNAGRQAEVLARRFADGPPAIVGSVIPNPKAVGRPLRNAALFLRDGRIEAVYSKRLLPTYDVFDEHRYFEPGDRAVVVEVAGQRVGLLVCEDLWVNDLVRGRHVYDTDPPADLKAAGIDVAVAIAASPYHQGKDDLRRALFSEEARRMGVPLVVAQQVGANDDVLFDGCSRAFDGQGRDLARLKAFEEDFRVIDLDAPADAALGAEGHGEAEELRRALVMGIRGYFRKTGFSDAHIGLSGGVDSGVTLCLAVDALGPDRVKAVAMPGPYSAPMSHEDAAAQADALGVELTTIPIGPTYEAFLEALAPQIGDRPRDVTEENLQSRTRGTILMALSNKLGSLVLATGNKSEMAVGYATLYGDMNGGLAVLSDVWKTRVYELARLYLAEGRIPRRTVERPPSAELAPDQKDTDSLPPYDVLDRILRLRIEEGRSLGEITGPGLDGEVVQRVLRLVEIAEYKRRQMAPGLKVTPTAFGVGWRMPIARPIDLRNEL